jgi:hypothetical protein
MKKLAAALIASVAATTAAAAQQPPLDLLLERAARYARGFQHDFETVIADETYVQQERQTRAQGRRSRVVASARTTSSEMLFMWVRDNQSWLTVRNVLKVDGRSVPDSRSRLERMLTGRSATSAPALRFEPMVSRLRQLRDESARFNLGGIRRNLNDPMLPFQFVDPAFQPRFTFTMAGPDNVGGISVWKLEFAEHATPTVVELDGGDFMSTGAVWITSSGIVIRTQLLLRNAETALNTSIVVTYGRDEKLAGWVPIRMDERYAQEPDASRNGGLGSEITCTATYSNFRRFETSARIVR